MGYSIAGELFGSWAAGLVIIAIRLYARRVTGARNFYWDDFCLGSAVVSAKPALHLLVSNMPLTVMLFRSGGQCIQFSFTF